MKDVCKYEEYEVCGSLLYSHGSMKSMMDTKHSLPVRLFQNAAEYSLKIFLDKKNNNRW